MGAVGVVVVRVFIVFRVIVMRGVICMVFVIVVPVVTVPVVVMIIVAMGIKQGVFAQIELGCDVRLKQGQDACVGREGFDRVLHQWREVFAHPHHDICVLQGRCLGRAEVVFMG